ncbi:MAG: M1 family metallopeptidase [Bacteroidetes bacterium]|nr:M1 family metallopeptidase [Bacteroidota bacterium]
MTRSFRTLNLLLIIVLAACQNNPSNTMQTETTPAAVIVKDPHTFAHPDEAVIKHLDLDLQVDFEKKILTGTARIEFERKKEISQLILDTRDLTIQKVLMNDAEKPLAFQLGDTVPYLGRALVVNLTPETKFITIYYSTSPSAAALQWLTPEQTAGKKSPFLFTQSQAILARTWAPVQDSPGIRFTYSATVHVPSGLMAVMSAENPQQKSADGVYHFKMPQPIPAYLLALAVGDFVFKPLDKRTGVYAEPVTVDKAAWEFVDLPKMVDAAEKLYGPYAWGQYDVIVLPPSFPFGGMENPRVTFATPTILAGDRSLTTLIAHELAHSWSGNLVTNATWNDFWMNEGFTVYFENRIMESLYGKDVSDMQSLLGFEDLKETIAEFGDTSADTHLKLNLEGRDPDDGMNDVAYEKGHFLLLLMEQTVGREKFDAFLNKHFSSHAFQTISTEQFIEEYNRDLIGNDTASAKKIDIDRWVYGPGIPNNCPKIHSVLFEEVSKQVDAWKKGASASSLQTKKYTTNEWIRFLRYLPSTLSENQMKELDETFHFSKTGNSEILFCWLELVIANKYTKNYPALKEFLFQVGRRKFVKPLYAALAKSPEGKILAKEIYSTARPNYHPITQATIDELLN